MIDLVINFDSSAEKAILYHNLKQLKGEQIIKIKKRHKGRTVQQNKYYWGVCLAYIADYIGCDTAYLHEIFKARFIPKISFDDEYLLSTASLSTIQLWEYVDEVRLFAKNELGINIPSPDGVIL